MTPASSVPFLDIVGLNASIRTELDIVWKEVLGHGKFVNGPELELFERSFAEFCDARHAVGVGNGTDALELILAALGIGVGDEVIVPANTFVATAEAVCAVGARPRFVDVDPGTLLLEPDAVAAAVGPATAAVIAVHLFGQMVDHMRLLPVVRRHGLVLVEDAAQAHGARFADRRAGSVGAAAAFSFYPGKNLGALGDGGAVVSDDTDLISRVRTLADHGRAPTNRHMHDVRGRNSRLDTVQAAVLSVKLRRLDEANRHRETVMAMYREWLPESCVPVEQHPLATHVHHLAVVEAADRRKAIERLDAHGIGWGIHYPVPCHRQLAFAMYAHDRMPVAESAAHRILSLPMSPLLSRDDVRHTCRALEGGAE